MIQQASVALTHFSVRVSHQFRHKTIYAGRNYKSEMCAQHMLLIMLRLNINDLRARSFNDFIATFRMLQNQMPTGKNLIKFHFTFLRGFYINRTQFDIFSWIFIHVSLRKSTFKDLSDWYMALICKNCSQWKHQKYFSL